MARIGTDNVIANLYLARGVASHLNSSGSVLESFIYQNSVVHRELADSDLCIEKLRAATSGNALTLDSFNLCAPSLVEIFLSDRFLLQNIDMLRPSQTEPYDQLLEVDMESLRISSERFAEHAEEFVGLIKEVVMGDVPGKVACTHGQRFAAAFYFSLKNSEYHEISLLEAVVVKIGRLAEELNSVANELERSDCYAMASLAADW